MVFGPLAGKSNGMDMQDLLPRVRQIASRLVEELQRAEELTGGWKDEPLGQALVDASLSPCLDQLAATGCWGEDNRLPSSELWRIAGTMLQRGWLQYHARIKPRGYAGDYLMLLRICRHWPCGDPWAGSSMATSNARPRRTPSARGPSKSPRPPPGIVSRPARTRTTWSASAPARPGPAPGARHPAGKPPGDAPRHAGQRRPRCPGPGPATARPLLPPAGLASVRTNLSRLPQPANAGKLPQHAQLLICTGLFDYLEPDAAVALLRLFWQRLAPGGLLLVGNFAPHNPSRAYMEWIGLWYLNYRTPAELEQLGLSAGIPPDRLAIGCDRTGLDLFLRASA